MTDVTDAEPQIVGVTQADRDEAAYAVVHSFGALHADNTCSIKMREGGSDDTHLVQAFARHREASIAPYVEALRDLVLDCEHRASMRGSSLRKAQAMIAEHDALLPDTKGE